MSERKKPHDSTGLTGAERRAATGLAAIFSLRMLGLFLVLPVFALFAQELDGATPMLIGLAIGMYGLTQAALQIPFGALSDRFGRKPIIAIGLLLFALGSVVAALGDSIWMVLLGRALQGAGAIAAAVMALAADLSREDHRAKVMAMIGMGIGASFLVALVAAPLLDQLIGVRGIFWMTAVLALAAILLLWRWVPPAPVVARHWDVGTRRAELKRVFASADLLRADLGIFLLHMMITALFVVLPVILRDTLDLAVPGHTWLYLAVLVPAVAVMLPILIFGEKNGRMKQTMVTGVGLLLVGCLGIALWGTSLRVLAFWLFVFFIGFNLLEASLPSLVSKLAPLRSRGTAMGVYSTSQFLGAFCGGASAGWVQSQYGLYAVFWLSAAASGLWLLVVLGMRQPRRMKNHVVTVGELNDDGREATVSRLSAIPGVDEVVLLRDKGKAVLRVDRALFDESVLESHIPI